MPGEVVIASRFRGPPDSANGGYACGVVAAAVDPGPAVEVTLRAPPPLDRALKIERAEGGVELRDEGTLLAEARPAPEPDVELPAPVSVEAAGEARERSPLHHGHPFPTCFVCGPGVADGLQIISGPVPGRETELVASPFRTNAGMAGEDGAVRPELIWSALDCPSGHAGFVVPGLGISVLGRLTAVIRRPPETGADYVAVGWPVGRDGRKIHSASAILDDDGEAIAVALATWIELADQPAG